MSLRYRHLVVVGLLLLALPAAAAAQSSEDISGGDQYTEPGIPGGETEPTETVTEPVPAPSPAPAPSGSGTQPAAEAAPAAGEAGATALPRTGADAGLLALAAVALLGGGFLLRRAAPHQSG